ncbi:Uncharacterised protein [Mycobacteroides abscessus subsp. massiliense]|nr:Uncharacterised protein [Mycobacteroides abscessus subsp. massiliense]
MFHLQVIVLLYLVMKNKRVELVKHVMRQVSYSNVKKVKMFH